MIKNFYISLLLLSGYIIAVDFETEIQPIFNATCIECHGTSGGLNLTSYDDLMSGGNGNVVIPGNGAESLLITKLRGTALGSQMPNNQNPLDESIIQLIEAWIDEGAFGSIPGCTNPNNTNYDETANVDDGSCIPDQFNYNSSTQQAFYFFTTVTINDELIEPQDWIGAFKGDVCVGSRQWNTDETMDVVVMGDCSDMAPGCSLTEGYMITGDIPSFKIFDASQNIYLDATPSEEFAWSNMGFNFADILQTIDEGCTDPVACNYNINIEVDDGSCEYPQTNYDCDNNCILLDCMGECGGTAIEDECGVCNGSGKDDDGCCSELGQPQYNGPADCSGECGGTAIEDECGICNGDSSSCDNTLLVPSEFSNIQSAIDSASEGDTVLVSAGTYYENINYNSTKNINILSISGSEETIIDGSNNDTPVINFSNGDRYFKGFTVKGANAHSGIWCLNSNIVLEDLIIENNESLDGCGGIKLDGVNSTINNITVKNNLTHGDGGGICIKEGSIVTIDNLTLIGNFTYSNAGGILITGSDVNISNSSISTNQTLGSGDYYGGGGIHINGGNLEISNTNIEGNISGTNGGGLYSFNANIILNNISVNDNVASYAGAGCYVKNGNFTINNSIIKSNVLFEGNSSDGGGLFVANGSFILQNVQIINNYAYNTGGGIRVDGSSTILELSMVKITGNSSDAYGGGIFISNNAIVNINHTTISENNGGGIKNDNGTLSIVNSIFYQNSPESLLGEADISYSDIQDGWAGSGNIDADPLFTDPDNGDYTLQPSSPCINSGDPESELDSDGTTADMGAYPTYQGCTDPLASNSIYDPYAIIDDGSCLYDYCHNDLHEGANLKSFYELPQDSSVENVITDSGCDIIAVISEGSACIINNAGNWMGQCTMRTENGYWLITQDDCQLCVEASIPTDPPIEYDLHNGANLISFSLNGSIGVSDALPNNIESYITAVIGEGTACIINSSGNWMGQCTLYGGNGYWLISNGDALFSWDLSTLVLGRTIEATIQSLDGYEYSQSTHQAFYFIGSVENINIGDWILAYNDNQIIGASKWQNSLLSVPVMGSDGYDFTKGYIEIGSTPKFKLLSGGTLINLEGDIPAFDNNQIYMVSYLTKELQLPETFNLNPAYPNPFNPISTISFEMPKDSQVTLSIYNLQGREVSTLINGNMQAGYHSVVWDANSYASGVYFLKMVTGKYISIQKLMLIK